MGSTLGHLGFSKPKKLILLKGIFTVWPHRFQQDFYLSDLWITAMDSAFVHLGSRAYQAKWASFSVHPHRFSPKQFLSYLKIIAVMPIDAYVLGYGQ
ncbi:MAG: hypothetical protein LBT59_19820 [Clostridiales bacterium]|jgi:hypothetical protein|nr:hypothetical protein [Clostridiales bacterium]